MLKKIFSEKILVYLYVCIFLFYKTNIFRKHKIKHIILNTSYRPFYLFAYQVVVPESSWTCIRGHGYQLLSR